MEATTVFAVRAPERASVMVATAKVIIIEKSMQAPFVVK